MQVITKDIKKKTLTINLKEKFFHNYVEWLGLGWGKVSNLQCSDYWKTTNPINLPKELVPPRKSFFEKSEWKKTQ